MGEKDCCQQHAAHDQRFLGIENQQIVFNENQGKIVESLNRLIERVTKTEESTKSAHHRLDGQEEQTRAIYQLAFEVKGFGEKQAEILALLTNHDERLEHIEQAPGQTAIKAWQWLLVGLAGWGLGTGLSFAGEWLKSLV